MNRITVTMPVLSGVSTALPALKSRFSVSLLAMVIAVVALCDVSRIVASVPFSVSSQFPAFCLLDSSGNPLLDSTGSYLEGTY